MKKNKKTLRNKNLFYLKRAFTLIELLVVIIIVGLLITIVFVSVIGHLADARNGKRINDLNFINSKLNIELSQGSNILNFVANSNNSISNPSIAGKNISNTSGAYNAGEINYTKLKIKAADYLDPNENSYVIGVTSLAGGVYQLATSVELHEYNIAKIIGTYEQRLSNDFVDGHVYGKIFKISDPFASGKFKLNDTIKTNYDANLITISQISGDGLVLTLSGTINENITAIAIADDETKGLINGKNSSSYDGIVVDNGVFLPY